MAATPGTRLHAVFRVKRIYIAVALLVYPVALLPLIVVWLSPRPGVAGWIAFGVLALAFFVLATASLCYALFARVVLEGHQLRYLGVWRSLTIDLSKVRVAYRSLKNVVFDVGERRKLVIPDVFEHRDDLLESIAEAKRTAPSALIADTAVEPNARDARPEQRE